MTVAVRELWRDRIWTARAWTLLEETPDGVVLANRPGSETRVPVDRDGSRLRVPGGDWELAAGRWEHWTLRVARPGEPWSTLLFFDERGVHLSWYVNLEQPLRRTPFGFDTLDHKLDVIVELDGSWRWKDEDQFEEIIERGLLPPEHAAPLREEAERAVERILERRPPFDRDWFGWRPDPSWPSPALPEGWDRV